MPPSSAQVPTILEKIGAYKLDEIAAAKKAVPLAELEAQAGQADAPRGFYRALKSKVADGQYGLICEIKKASPSKGLIRANFFPGQLAEAYFKGGATCLSVLTDGPSFQGSPDFLIEARGRVPLPVLRKDFMCDPYQVWEAAAWGADVILLIVAALDRGALHELHTVAAECGLDVLVESHTAREMELALELDGAIIGVNSRDLKTLKTDLQVAVDLAPMMPGDRLCVAESGIKTRADIEMLLDVGYNGFLIGEALMADGDPAAKLSELLGSAE